MEYLFTQLSEEQLAQIKKCQRAFCADQSKWTATIPVKRYNGFTRNIFLCERHKIKLEKKSVKTLSPKVESSHPSSELETETW